MSNEHIEKSLEIFAAQIRLETLKELKELGFGHIGGAMSIVETLAVLYGAIMKVDPERPQWDDRDWLVVSKGHAGPALYAALALKGYFPQEELKTLNKPGTNLPSHCDRLRTIGVDMTTGSLGQGMSTAIGVAYGHKIRKKSNITYLIIGDGECDEGQIWEGAMFASHHKLDNLIALVDVNKKQLDGYTQDILDLGNLGPKFLEFGWHVIEVDGSDVIQIHEALQRCRHRGIGQPSMIVLDTIKGKGCTFAEQELFNHHMAISPEKADGAIAYVEKRLDILKKS
jgi:transketolase